jgi:DHA1 family bicyclomycin/chloramphenicol resistance-like MFS transporter
MVTKRHISQGTVAAIILVIVLITRMGGNILIPSIPTIAGEFGIDKARATVNINLYSIVLALSFAFFGPITDVVKSRTLLLIGSMLCVISYLICGLAVNIAMIDLGRVILASGSSLIIITSQTWIGNRSGKDDLLSRLAWFSMLVALAPMLAPVLGGFITEHATWRWNFWLMLILSLVVVMVIVFLKSSKNNQQTKRASLKPLALLKNYNDIILNTPLFSISIIVFTLFMLQGAFLAFSSFLIIDELGYTAVQYGFVSLFFVSGLFLGRLPTIYLAKRFPIRTVMLMNTALVVLSLSGSLLFYVVEKQHTIIEIVGLMTLMCFGFSGLSVIGVRNSMLIDPARKGAISGVYSFLSQITGWLGIILTQLFFHFKFLSLSIYNYFLILSLILITVGLYLFLTIYPRFKHVLENESK